MNKLLFSILTVVLLTAFVAVEAQAQVTSRSSTEDYFDDKPTFKQRLWYGGGFNIGFSGGNFNGLGATNTFFLGLSPMVGYKITDWLSVGPRVEATWVTQRFDIGNNTVGRFNTVDFALGPFARVKPLPNFFAHTEFQYVNIGVPDRFDGGSNKFINRRETTERFYIGGGYSSGGVISTELYLLYDVLDPNNSTQLPIDFRFGITWNF